MASFFNATEISYHYVLVKSIEIVLEVDLYNEMYATSIRHHVIDSYLCYYLPKLILSHAI